MEVLFSHKLIGRANSIIKEHLAADFPLQTTRNLLEDYNQKGDCSISFVEFAADRLNEDLEKLFSTLARVAGSPLVDPNTLPPPILPQFHFDGLPLYLLAASPVGTATLVTGVPFLDQLLPKTMLQKYFGALRVSFVLALPAKLRQFAVRLYNAEMLTQAWFDPEREAEVPPGPSIADREAIVSLGLAQDADFLKNDFNLAAHLKSAKPSEDQADALTAWMALMSDLPFVSLSGALSPEKSLSIIPSGMQRRYHLCPVALIGNTITLATSKVLASHQRAEIANMLPSPYVVAYVLAWRHKIDKMITGNESRDIVAGNIAQKIEVEASSSGSTVELIDVQALSEKAGHDQATVVELVKAVLIFGVQHNATDIHISEHPTRMWVRYRIDGLLQDHPGILKNELTNQVISRIKILAGIDTQYSPLPQDGKFSISLGGQEYDIRVCTTNTIHGSKAVLRIQPKTMQIPSLEHLGFHKFEIGIIQHTLAADHGLLVICGPTGAGKSTTLYAAIGMIDRTVYNVCTAEQPVEIRIPNVEQTNIRANAGLTFARYIESVLRQDPDYIMIGETRDRETALQILRAAITGHTVLTTLHTNSAAAAPSRLFDLGCEPFLLGDALTAVCAQRLIRKICPECSYKTDIPTLKALQDFRIKQEWLGSAKHLVAARGCSHCRGTGFQGRFGIMEAFQVDDTIRAMIRRNAPVSEIQKCQVEAGGKSLYQHAVEAAAAGMTTLQEALGMQSLQD